MAYNKIDIWKLKTWTHLKASITFNHNQVSTSLYVTSDDWHSLHVHVQFLLKLKTVLMMYSKIQAEI